MESRTYKKRLYGSINLIMLWFIYTLTVILFSHLLATFSQRGYFFIFLILTTALLTPTQIESLGSIYAPSIPTFFLNVILEQDFSDRPLRPLILTMPVCFFVYFLIFFIKKRFSQS